MPPSGFLTAKVTGKRLQPVESDDDNDDVGSYRERALKAAAKKQKVEGKKQEIEKRDLKKKEAKKAKEEAEDMRGKRQKDKEHQKSAKRKHGIANDLYKRAVAVVKNSAEDKSVYRKYKPTPLGPAREPVETSLDKVMMATKDCARMINTAVKMETLAEDDDEKLTSPKLMTVEGAEDQLYAVQELLMYCEEILAKLEREAEKALS